MEGILCKTVGGVEGRVIGEEELEREEVKGAIRRIKNGKAAGGRRYSG